MCSVRKTEIRKISCCGSRSPSNAEFGHFALLLCRGRQWNYNARALLLFCSSNLLFGGVLVAVAVVFRVRSLQTVCPGWGEEEGRLTGNQGEIWHCQDFKCQFPHPWVSIISQIPTPGDRRPSIVPFNEMIETYKTFIAAPLQRVNSTC